MLLFVTGNNVLQNAQHIATQQSLSAAVFYLQKKYRFCKFATVRFGLFLYEYLSQLESEHLFDKQEPGGFIIHFCCWGKEYTEKAKKYLLPSLNSASNLSAIAKCTKSIVLIHCDEATKSELMQSIVVKQLQSFIEIKFLILPQKLLAAFQSSQNYPDFSFFKKINQVTQHNKYFLLGGLQCYALKIALQHKAYISFMMPDFLLSDLFMAQAFSKIKDKVLVVTTSFRTDYQKVKKTIDSFYSNSDVSSLSIPASILTELQIEHIHPAAKRRVVSEQTEKFSPSAQLIFEAPDGFIIRSFHYHPILINCSRITHALQIGYMPIDGDLNCIVSNNKPYDQQVEVCDDSSIFSFMELSDENVEGGLSSDKNKLSYSELVQQVRKMIANVPHMYDEPLNRYFSSIRYSVAATNFTREKTGINDRDFFSKLAIQSLDNGKQF